MKIFCDRCGSPETRVCIGSALLCSVCAVDIQSEIKEMRKKGKPVNVIHIARKHFKENFGGGTYILRDIPADLELQWKERALKDRCNQRDILLAAMFDYFKK